METLDRRIFGIPLWIVGLAVAGIGVGIYLFMKSRNTSSSGGVLGQNTATTQPDPNIDPNTGIPYQVEEATNPQTGLPVYLDLLNQGNGMQTSPITGSPSPTPTPPTPPAPTPPAAPAPVQAPQPSYATVTARTWPQPDSSLYSIWQNNGRGIPFSSWESQVLRLNPNITNPNLIYPNQQIKIPA